MPPQGPSPALFFDTISAYQRTEALRAAIELDLFSHVAAGRQTANELASACQAAPRGIRILADYLTILGFLDKHGDRYELTADAKVFLDRKSPAYLGGAVSFLLAPELKECFQELTAAVRRGGTAVSDEGTVSHDNPIWVAFAGAMGPLMQMPAQLLAGLVGGDTGQPLRVLDVAAGHGLFGIAIANHYRQAHVTALDWPNVLAVAAENARGQMLPTGMLCVQAVRSTLIGAARTTSCSSQTFCTTSTCRPVSSWRPKHTRLWRRVAEPSRWNSFPSPIASRRRRRPASRWSCSPPQPTATLTRSLNFRLFLPGPGSAQRIPRSSAHDPTGGGVV